MKPHIKYRKGYKYQLVEDYTVEAEITQVSRIRTEFIDLNETGLLTVRNAYAWDGPSGPAFDTKDAMRGSLGHDALCQLMRMGLLDRKWIREANKSYHKWCLEDKMWPPRAWWHFKGAIIGGASATSVTSRKRIIVAPVLVLFILISGCVSMQGAISTKMFIARELLNTSEEYICRLAPIGEVRDRYFVNEQSAKAWTVICNAYIEFLPQPLRDEAPKIKGLGV